MDALLRRHQDRIWAICRRLAGNDADAADAAQEAMLLLVRRLDTFDGRSRFTTWAHRVTTNACLDELRRRRRRPDPGLPDDQTTHRAIPARGPAVDAEVSDRLTVDAALATLPEEFRLPIVLRDLGGHDYAEIAEILDLPPGTVRSRIARGRRRLADLLCVPDPGEPTTTSRTSKPSTMTDSLDPTDRTPDADDEVASAYLDGAATRGEIERVESDDALADRVGELSAVSGQVRDVLPPPPGALDTAISAALADYDRMEHRGARAAADASPDEGSTAPVVDLAARRPLWQRVPLGAVAAVVVLVALVGVVGLASRTGDDGDDTAASAFEDSAGDSADDAGAAIESDALSETATDDMATEDMADAPEAAGAVERLRFSSADALADYLRDQLEPTPATSADAGEDSGADRDDVGGDGAGDADVDPCDAVQVIGLDPSTVRTLVPVRLDGAAATAVVHGGDGDERLVVLDDATCGVVVDREL